MPRTALPAQASGRHTQTWATCPGRGGGVLTRRDAAAHLFGSGLFNVMRVPGRSGDGGAFDRAPVPAQPDTTRPAIKAALRAILLATTPPPNVTRTSNRAGAPEVQPSLPQRQGTRKIGL